MQSAQASAARRGGLQVDVVQAALSGQWDLKARTASPPAAPTRCGQGYSAVLSGFRCAHPATALAKRWGIEFVPCEPIFDTCLIIAAPLSHSSTARGSQPAEDGTSLYRAGSGHAIDGITFTLNTSSRHPLAPCKAHPSARIARALKWRAARGG